MPKIKKIFKQQQKPSNHWLRRLKSEAFRRRNLCGYPGLCSFIVSHFREDCKAIELFEPTDDDQYLMVMTGKDITYWGSDDNSYKTNELTELRANILIFISLMEDDCQEEAKEHEDWPLV